jgi:hypothetical protein
MRNKKNILTAAFIVTFVLSVGLAKLFVDENDYQSNIAFDRDPVTAYLYHRGDYTAHEIEVFLRQDDSYGRALDRKLFQIDRGLVSPFASSSFSEYADGVSEYADQSGNLPADGLPKDFQIAWNAHMKAWRDYADFLNRWQDSSDRIKMNREKLYDLDNEYNSEINSTWYEVLRVADEHGSDFR